MTVKELYDANSTPYDEVLIKFKDEEVEIELRIYISEGDL